MNILLQFVIAAVVMGVIDALWLGKIAKKLYYQEIGSLLLKKPNMPAAVAFYVIYVVGIVLFAVNPALEIASWHYALGYGALFGFIAYATYDLTNLATLKGWSRKIVIVDMAWGAVLTGTVAVVTYLVMSQWFL